MANLRDIKYSKIFGIDLRLPIIFPMEPHFPHGTTFPPWNQPEKFDVFPIINKKTEILLTRNYFRHSTEGISEMRA